MPVRPALLITALTGCLACGEIPEVGGDLSPAERNAPFPALLPINTLLSGGPTTPQITEASVETLAGRITALRTRASRLSAPVVDGPTRAKMRAAIARAALR